MIAGSIRSGPTTDSRVDIADGADDDSSWLELRGELFIQHPGATIYGDKNRNRDNIQAEGPVHQAVHQ